MHQIIRVAIIEHALGDGGRGVLFVCQNPNLGRPLDEGTVELLPWTPRQRDDAHVVIRHHETVRQHLQGIEGGEDLNVCIRMFPLDGIGKAEEQRVA